MKLRICAHRLKKLVSSARGRLTVLTGARQTGKSFLLKMLFASDYQYLSLDDPEVRHQLNALSAEQFAQFFPKAIFDEAQKLPELFDKIKAAYDASESVRYILSGSSQILLLKKISESLAGRAALVELYPLTIPELQTNIDSFDDTPGTPLVSELIDHLAFGKTMESFFKNINPVLSILPEYAQAQAALETYLHVGGMPALTNINFTEVDRQKWLKDYNTTYLQRDVADLAKLDSLEPFVSLQKALASRNGTLLNYTELGSAIGVSSPTVKRYIRYLELSYQVLLLAPWHKNPIKRMSYLPRVVFIDPGICRALQNRTGDITGQEFEASVIAEVYKQIKSCDLEVQLYSLRTADGREIDLLIELPSGYVGIEIKQAKTTSTPDARHFRNIETIIDKPFLGGIVLSNDQRIRYESKITTLFMPVSYALGTSPRLRFPSLMPE